MENNNSNDNINNDYIERNPFELMRFNGMSEGGQVAKFSGGNWYSEKYVEMVTQGDRVKQARIEQLEIMHQKQSSLLKHVVRVINEFLPDYEEDDDIIEAFSSLFNMHFGWDVGEVHDPRRRELEIDIEVLVKKRITLNIKTMQGKTDPDEIEDHIKDVFSNDPDANHLCFEDSIFEVIDMHTDSEETEDVDVTIL